MSPERQYATMEARSPGRRSNVENAPRRRPVTGQPAMPSIAHSIGLKSDGTTG